jgi:hypothetical protein
LEQPTHVGHSQLGISSNDEGLLFAVVFVCPWFCLGFNLSAKYVDRIMERLVCFVFCSDVFVVYKRAEKYIRRIRL